VLERYGPDPKQKPEVTTGIEKWIIVTMDAEACNVHVRHRMFNHNPWAVELAP